MRLEWKIFEIPFAQNKKKNETLTRRGGLFKNAPSEPHVSVLLQHCSEIKEDSCPIQFISFVQCRRAGFVERDFNKLHIGILSHSI